MDFEQRLERAIDRGKQTRTEQGARAQRKAMTEEDLKNLHSRCRIELSDHIDSCLRKLADHFPGFEFQTLVSDTGWGAKVMRDDLRVGADRRPNSVYSRLEMVIRPYSSAHIVELAAKGTVQNKEVFTRSHFQNLEQVDLTSFSELIDLWVLEYAEQYAART
jgi:hypothetical protein